MAKSDWVNFEWHGLECEAEVITGDTMGDASVPGGIYHMPTYIDSCAVYAPDGEDIADKLTDDAYKHVMDSAMQLVRDI
jgi:hypothetical protein